MKTIIEKVKSYESACEVLGIDPKELPIVDNLPEKDRKSIVAYYKLSIITRALNEGWEPNWKDYSERKWWNIFYTDSASGFVYSDTDYSYTDTSFGARLCFKNGTLAEFARKEFHELYIDFLYIDAPKVVR